MVVLSRRFFFFLLSERFPLAPEATLFSGAFSSLLNMLQQPRGNLCYSTFVIRVPYCIMFAKLALKCCCEGLLLLRALRASTASLGRSNLA